MLLKPGQEYHVNDIGSRLVLSWNTWLQRGHRMYGGGGGGVSGSGGCDGNGRSQSIGRLGRSQSIGSFERRSKWSGGGKGGGLRVSPVDGFGLVDGFGDAFDDALSNSIGNGFGAGLGLGTGGMP